MMRRGEPGPLEYRARWQLRACVFVNQARDLRFRVLGLGFGGFRVVGLGVEGFGFKV